MKVAYVISDNKYGESERKLLHYIVETTRFAQVIVLLFQSNRITEDLERLKIPYKHIKGIAAATTYIKHNHFDVINVLGSTKIATNIANFTKKAKVTETHFSSSTGLAASGRSILLEKSVTGAKNATVMGVRLSPKLLKSSSGSDITFVARDLDNFNLLVPAKLADCLDTHKDSIKIVIYSTNSSATSSKIKALTNSTRIIYNPIEALSELTSSIVVDSHRDNSVGIDTWESAFLAKTIVANSSDGIALKTLVKDAQLYEPSGSMELLRLYSMTKNEQPSSIPVDLQFKDDLKTFYEELLARKITAKQEIDVVTSPAPTQPSELAPFLSPTDKTYIIVPYTIYGGAEVYLSNYLEGQDPSLVTLVFLANNIQFLRKWQSTFECINTDLPRLANVLMKREASRVLFYNSRSVYQTLAKIKQNKTFELIEIVHSYHHWQDSMHGALRSSVDKIYAVSNTVGKQWGLAKYEVVSPKIDASRFKLPRRTSAGKITIGTVARYSPEKNLFKILEVAAHLDERFNFVIVGQDGGIKKELLKHIRAKGLTDRFTLKDYTDHVETDYATFDLFLLTSVIEGAPLTILEAKAAGLPIVASDVGSVKEMLSGYQKSHTFDVKTSTAAEIATQIKNLLHVKVTPLVLAADGKTAEDLIASVESTEIELEEAELGNGPRILLVTNGSWDKWINYSPAYWICLAFDKDPDCDIVELENLESADLSKYRTVVFCGKLDFWDKDPIKYDKKFRDHIKWHVQNDLHSHSMEIQKTKIRHASYVNWITSAYPLSVEESDLHNRRKGKLIPLQANCPYRHKLVRLPHALLDTFEPIITPLRDRKDVILTGHSDRQVYPWRVATQKMYNLPTLEHPGYDVNRMKHKITHQKYLDTLGEYKVSFADGGVVNYAVNKYIEVPFAGCVLICKDIPELSLMGFKHGKNCFMVDTPAEVKPILADVLKNPDKYQPIATAGQRMVVANHMAKHRWAYLKRLIRSAENTDRPVSRKHVWYDNDPFAGA